MKKIAKISLVAAIAVAGFSTAQADTLAEAFAASKVKGEIKSQYFQKEKSSGVDAKSSAWTNGGNLSLTTGSFYGLSAGVTFQTAHVTALDDDANSYAGDQDVQGTTMSESYLAYTLGNTTAKAGRQFISTPLVAGSGSRIFRQSYEGFVLANTDIPNTTLVAAYINKYQGRTDSSDGSAPKFVSKFDLQGGSGTELDGAYSIYAKNTSIDNLTLQAQYAVAQVAAAGADDVKIIYGDAAYKFTGVSIAAQALQSDTGASDNGSLYGVKAEGDIAGVSIKVAYTKNSDKADIIAGLGYGADVSYTASPIGTAGVGNYDANNKSYQIALGYKFDSLSLNAVYTDRDTDGVTDYERDLSATYNFNKNLSVTALYAEFEKVYDYRSRLYVSYKF